MQTRIYKLEPVAEPGDQNWDLAADQGVVIVRAASAGQARAIASHAEAAAMGNTLNPGATQIEASALWNPALYHVAPYTGDEYPADGPQQVLSASFTVPQGYVPARD